MASFASTGFRLPALKSAIVLGNARECACIATFNLKEQNALLRGTKLISSARYGRSARGYRLKCNAGLDEIAPATAAAYGLTLLGGGITAYARTGSKGSLVGGCTGGIALALAYILMLNPETKDLANAIAFGSAFLFIAVFGIRLAATRKPIPSGLLMAISIAASVIFVNAYFDARLS